MSESNHLLDSNSGSRGLRLSPEFRRSVTGFIYQLHSFDECQVDILVLTDRDTGFFHF